MIEYPHNKTHQKHNGKTVEQSAVKEKGQLQQFLVGLAGDRPGRKAAAGKKTNWTCCTERKRLNGTCCAACW